ncbi:hypothetical protein MMC34_003356 [Xylographa carneopallida]|nr:hypothetical protein [Xylographa carneopallida]
MHILKVLAGVALFSGGGFNVLAFPTDKEVQDGETVSLGMLGDCTNVPGKWVGPITPGGPNVNITGQLQDVYKIIRQMNPNYDPSEFGYLNEGHGNTTGIAKRNMILPPNCNVPYPAARADYIKKCIQIAENSPGAMCIGPGPRVCLAMVGSSDGQGCNAIYLCNDNSSNGASYVHGQEFDTDGYNVIVSSGCNSPGSKRVRSASLEVERREPDTLVIESASHEVEPRKPDTMDIRSASLEVERRESDAAGFQTTCDKVERREPDALGMIGDYKILPAQWAGPVTAGGPNVTFIGNSFQHIRRQILDLNPAYDSEINNQEAKSTIISKRNAILPPNCNVPYWPARLEFVNRDIAVTATIPPGACVAPEPRVCYVVSGQSDKEGCNAIYLCNDNPYTICSAPAYLGGNYAQRIADACTYSSNGVSWVHGAVR